MRPRRQQAIAEEALQVVTCRFTEIQHMFPGRDNWQGPARTVTGPDWMS